MSDPIYFVWTKDRQPQKWFGEKVNMETGKVRPFIARRPIAEEQAKLSLNELADLYPLENDFEVAA